MAKKKKENSLMREAKNTVGVGVTSMAGYGVLGAMGSVPGMPAQAAGVIPIAGAGLQLANVGQLAKTGLSLAKSLQGSDVDTGYRKKVKSRNQNRIRRMLG